MKIKLINHSFGPAYKPLGEALYHDFKLMQIAHPELLFDVSFETPVEQDIPASWLKLKYVLSSLDGVDWVVWVDSDVAIVDTSFTPETFIDESKDIIMSTDPWGICTGIFAARNTQWTKDFLTSVWNLGTMDRNYFGQFDGRDTWEQNSMKLLLRYFESVRKRFGSIPEAVVQNRCSDFSERAWLYHFWMAGRSPSEILRKRANLRTLGWSEVMFRSFGIFDELRWRDAQSLARRLGLLDDEMKELISFSGDIERTDCLLPADCRARLQDLTTFVEQSIVTIGAETHAIAWITKDNRNPSKKTPLETWSHGTNWNDLLISYKEVDATDEASH